MSGFDAMERTLDKVCGELDWVKSQNKKLKQRVKDRELKLKNLGQIIEQACIGILLSCGHVHWVDGFANHERVPELADYLASRPETGNTEQEQLAATPTE